MPEPVRAGGDTGAVRVTSSSPKPCRASNMGYAAIAKTTFGAVTGRSNTWYLGVIPSTDERALSMPPT